MNREGWLFLAGVGVGATLMYMLDPDRGGRRRALVRDQLVGASNKAGMYAGKFSRDISNRAQGLVAETRARFRGEEVPDDVLVERVKAELGRHPVHHRALDITAREGRVSLRGPALASEVDELISAVSSVRGVTGVDDQLEVHEQAGNIPGLQGQVVAPATAG
jgi:osmotically-inducible protein OsmY